MRNRGNVTFADIDDLVGCSIRIEDIVNNGIYLRNKETYFISVKKKFDNGSYLGMLSGYGKNIRGEMAWDYPNKIGEVIFKVLNDEEPYKAGIIGRDGSIWDGLYYDTYNSILTNSEELNRAHLQEKRYIKLTLDNSFVTFVQGSLKRIKR